MAMDSVGLVTFTVQEGWTRTVYPDATVYASPVSGNGESCQLTVFPMRPAQTNLFDAALAIFREIFRTEPLTGSPMPDAALFRGASPLGWDYVIVRKSMGGDAGYFGALMGAILLVARVGADLGVVAATSKEPLPGMCFGDMVGRSWAAFFHSLRFMRARSRALDTAWRQRLAGAWSSETETAAHRYAFAPNGRYAGAAAVQHRTQRSNTEVMVTTDAHFGDGVYSVEGNAIAFTPDEGSGVTRRFFRLEQESPDRGRTWADRLCLLTGGEGEVCYQRDQ
jgi:hypothetical protein